MVASICLLVIITLVYMYYKLIIGLNSYLHFSLDPQSHLRGNHTLPAIGRLQHTKFKYFILFYFKYFKLKSCSQEMGRRKWQPTPGFLPRESCTQEPWWAAVHRVAESDTAEVT